MDRKDCTRSDILNNNGSVVLLKILYLRILRKIFQKKVGRDQTKLEKKTIENILMKLTGYKI